ncbi:MAG: carboxymuconolactone decarboxylase family protein [Woeseiaceae bacterium]
MQPLPLKQWDESLDHVAQDMNGRPLNVHSLMANHPDLLDAWWRFRNYAVRGGDLSQRDCELLILRVAVHMHCWYEWASHVDRGLATGLTIEEIERVQRGPGAEEWSSHDAVLLQSVDELIIEHGIADTTRKQLSAHFTDNQVMDVIAIHGMYVTLGCMINTWGLTLDEAVEARLPDSVSQTDFEDAVSRVS